MSYILEALRKADAERSLSAGSPSSAWVTPPPGGQKSALRRSGTPARWALVLTALAGLATLVWFTVGRPPPPTAPLPDAIAPPSPAEAPAARDSAPGVAPPTPDAPLPGSAARAEPILAPEPPPPERIPVPVPVPASAPALATGPGPGPAPGASTPSPTVPGAALFDPQPAPGAPNPTPAAPGPRAAALPAPSANGLNVTGATYSDNPAHRMLIINGKVVAEGQEVEPGLVLEVITPRSAVLNRGGSRFNINY